MKNYLFLLLLFALPFSSIAQKKDKYADIIPYDEKKDEGSKLIYNYTYGSFYYAGSDNLIMSVSSVSYITNGRQQFGLGGGVSFHVLNSDSGKIKFTSVPVFLSNKFFLLQNETKGGLYLDLEAGFNLPVSALYESGEKAGKPVDPEQIRSTGLYGAALGWRFTGKKNYRELNYIVELGYRNQHLPFIPDSKKYSSDFIGLNLGLSF